jgi:hypothetical protein
MTDVPKVTGITLPAQMTDEHQRLLVKYARLPRSVTRVEWIRALAAFDLLHGGRLTLGSETLWRELNGEPTPCGWETIARVLPAVAQVAVRGEALVVVPYAEWKARVLGKQLQEGGNTP